MNLANLVVNADRTDSGRARGRISRGRGAGLRQAPTLVDMNARLFLPLQRNVYVKRGSPRVAVLKRGEVIPVKIGLAAYRGYWLYG